MRANQAMLPIHAMCTAFGNSRSGDDAWAGRRPSARAEADAVLNERITAIHKSSKETYGAPRIHAEFADDGMHVARKRVERLMKAAGIAGVRPSMGSVDPALACAHMRNAAKLFELVGMPEWRDLARRRAEVVGPR